MALHQVIGSSLTGSKRYEIAESDPKVYEYYQEIITSFSVNSHHWIEEIQSENRLTQDDKDDLIQQII